MHIQQGVHGLQLDYNHATHEKIQAIGIIDDEVLVFYRTKLLLLEGNISQPQFVSQSPLVCGFKQAWP